MADIDTLGGARVPLSDSPLSDVRSLTADRTTWHVVEVFDKPEPRLLFWSTSHLRIAQTYPPHWELLPDDELFALGVPYETVRPR